MDFKKRRYKFLAFFIGFMILRSIGGKCRVKGGEKASAPRKVGSSIFDCLDGGSGTLVCGIKESVKLYTNNIRTAHVELARTKATESSLSDALSQGIESKAAATQAKKAGEKAAKLAMRKADRVLGPFVSSAWDLFETLYYQGIGVEGFLRGGGTLCGTFAVGGIGEERFGRFGYLIGSQFGSWVGGKIGLMAYDVVNGLHCLFHFGQV